MPNVSVSITPVLEDEHGILRVWQKEGRANGQGRFSATVPRAPRYDVAATSMSSVYWSGSWEVPEGRSVFERDILVSDK